MEFISDFKQFLFQNASNIGLITVITAACLVVLGIVMRELIAWFAKTDRVLKEIKELKSEVAALEQLILNLKSHNPSVLADQPVLNVKSELADATNSQKKELLLKKESSSHFTINH